MKLLFFGILLVATSCAAKPVIQFNRTVYNGGDYELKCEYAEVVNETNFSWQKDDVELNETSEIFRILDADENRHNGSYTCAVTNGAAESLVSDPLTIVVIFVAGKKCDKDDDCIGSEYKKKCNTTEPGRCECAEGYQTVQDKCQGSGRGGASTVISSLALLFAALVSSRTLH